MLSSGNVLVIVAIAKDRHLNGLQNWFIASLAVSDLFVGLFVMPLTLANELMGYWVFGRVMCELWLSTDVLLCTASILNLVLISLDRYWSITKAISYVRLRTRGMAAGMIAAVWALSMIVCLPPLVGWKRPPPKTFGYPLVCKFNSICHMLNIEILFIVVCLSWHFQLTAIAYIYCMTKRPKLTKTPVAKTN